MTRPLSSVVTKPEHGGLRVNVGTHPRDAIFVRVLGTFTQQRESANVPPEAVRRTPRRRAAFFDSYISTLIDVSARLGIDDVQHSRC